MSADKAPATKLPLAARKNFRDGWEAKKGELEEKIEALLGVKWTLTCDPLVIYPYAEPNSYGHNSPGDCIYAYFDAFAYSLKYFIEKHGAAGVTELNTVCPTHVATFLPSTKFTYCGSIVADGQLQLVFHPNNLGSNISNVADDLAKTLSVAPQPAGASPLSYAARHSVKIYYDATIDEMTEKVKKILQRDDFKFDPGFEVLGAALKGGKGTRDDWESNLGSFAIAYFEGFLDILNREKFAEDEMLREGLAEGAPSGVVKLRVVEKLVGGDGSNGYNEVLIEDGDVIIQTTPEKWGSNIHYAADKLVAIL